MTDAVYEAEPAQRLGQVLVSQPGSEQIDVAVATALIGIDYARVVVFLTAINGVRYIVGMQCPGRRPGGVYPGMTYPITAETAITVTVRFVRPTLLVNAFVRVIVMILNLNAAVLSQEIGTISAGFCFPILDRILRVVGKATAI